jgi:hypothetical protein
MSDRDDERTDPRRDSESTVASDAPEQEGTPLEDGRGVYIPRDDDASDEASSSTGEADVSEEDVDSRSDANLSIDFAGFVTSLGTNCMINIGEVEHPEIGETIENLPAARQTLDILKMLRHKTRGNLEREERNLLKSLIHDAEQAYQRAIDDDS